MVTKFIEDEREVAKVKVTLIKELKAAHKELQRTGDYDKFGIVLRGLYRSYATCSNPNYQRAMREVLAGATKEGLDPEIIGGNYGLKVQIHKENERHIKIAQDIAERHGRRASEQYLSGLNQCEQYALCMSLEDSKKFAKSFDGFVKWLAESVCAF